MVEWGMRRTHEKNAPDLKSIVRYSGKLVETNEQDFTVYQVVLCRCWRECRNDITALSSVRSGLIKKGMIYSPSHGVMAFTVPLFDEFMRRAMPDGE